MKEKLVLAPPKLIIITGIGGSGKTLLSRELAERIETGYLSKDEIGDRYTAGRGPDYVRTFRDKVYEILFVEAEKVLARDNAESLIIDASFRKQLKVPGWESPYRELASSYKKEFRLVRLTVSEDVLKQRLIERKSSYDDHKLATEGSWREWLVDEPIDEKMPEGTLVVNNDQGLILTVEAVVRWLAGQEDARF